MSWQRLLAWGLAGAAAAGVLGVAVEWWRFGPTTATASRRVEAAVRSDFQRMNAALSRVADRIAEDPAAAAGLARGADAERGLFDLVARARESADASNISVTIYDAQGTARAWGGRPSEIPPDRIAQPATFFVKPSPLGLRLVYVVPVSGADARRLGAVAAEHVLSPAPAAATITPADYVIATPLAPAALRMRWEGAGDRDRPGAFVLRGPDGSALVEASVAEADLRAARIEYRERTGAVVLACCAVTVLLLIGPLLDRRAAAAAPAPVIRSTIVAIGLLALGTVLLWLAFLLDARDAPATPLTLLLAGFAAASSVALLAGPVSRLRIGARADRREPTAAPGRFVAQHLAAGVLVTVLYLFFSRLLDGAVDPVSVDLRHFSLHPWNLPRVMLLGGILAFHTAILWAATLVLTAARSAWRIPRSAPVMRFGLLTLWIAPAAAGAALSAWLGWPVSLIGLVLSAFASALAALFAHRVVVWYRRATLAARILALFISLLLPALLLYAPMDFLAERVTRRLITTRYAVEAQNHPQTLLDTLHQAQREIDALPILPTLVSGEGTPAGAPRTDSAFFVWSQTALARARLTSAVELYDADGKLVSRFALNFPEYTGVAQTSQTGRGCTWEVFGEAARFGSDERRVLHAERSICVSRAPEAPPDIHGTIVVHVGFDYRTLPFITSQSPYFELFRSAETGAPGEGTAGGDVDVAIYGWGLRPLYTSATSAWPITDQLFSRIYASRDPFWADIRHGDRRYRVYFSNDRYGIYAIGYPRLTLFDHLVHLAELTTLAAAGFVLVLVGAALFTRVARERPRTGRALLREIRASFYRKLLLAFVLAAVVPVLILALVIRTYFANLLLADVEDAAARTATVAQRVIAESDALTSPSADGVSLVSDDVLIWVSQLIDQDVNIFQGAQLVATSERDLFASGLLPTRTPDDVYRAIALEHAPSYVREDRIGTFSYMIAATPVRAGGRDSILTVPMATRQREIEREIDDLDRGVHLASLFFILLGAGIGLSMAERIADPVKRLTRATQQIARGDFDARIAVRSADELRRLVDAFNSMAAELKAQRTQLERTHRLEAWAEMARQVAHEIKNPLTPIQLSAEHLRRVHADQGEPLGGVLDTCVSSILGQVRLLRQISAEFSNFASSPTARPTRVDVPALIAEVVDPYRTGLSGRVDVVNRVTGPLPPVYVDRTLIARALANAVENALHAMPGAGTLTIDAEATEADVIIRIADTGVGMDEEALARVFEPYFSTKTSGTGLGLPIARRNVELSGGTIDVASTKGVGTSVTLRLPVARG